MSKESNMETLIGFFGGWVIIVAIVIIIGILNSINPYNLY